MPIPSRPPAYRTKFPKRCRDPHKPVDERGWREFSSALHYQCGQFDDPSSYRELADRLAEIDREHGTAGNRLFYLATPPEVFPVIIRQLGAAGLNRPRDEAVCES